MITRSDREGQERGQIERFPPPWGEGPLSDPLYQELRTQEQAIAAGNHARFFAADDSTAAKTVRRSGGLVAA